MSFIELDERNLVTLRDILEKASANDPGRNAIEQKIGDFYGSCMDEKAVDAKGLDSLKPELDRIAAVNDKAALIDAIARVHLIGPNPLFNFYSNSDLHNADQVIAYIDQGGLSLPDRDYYIERRRPDDGNAQAPGGIRDPGVHSGGAIFHAGGGLGANRLAHRDRVGQSLDGPHPPSRPQEREITR